MRSAMVLTVASLVCVTAGCSSSGPSSRPTGTATAPDTSAYGPPRTAASSHPGTLQGSTSSSHRAGGTISGRTAQAIFDQMTEKQRVGQLLMVDCPSTDVASATVAAIKQDAVGAVILDGTTSGGMSAVRQVTSELENDNPSPAKLFIATDQEGGEVQRLQGEGYTTIPSAVQQGQLSISSLQSDAKQWGGELVDSGVNVDLAPVLDTVPTGGGPNPPIGDLQREYGHDPATVGAHGLAFVRGLAAAGVDATVKHFPGLGRVTGNTDTTSDVTDSVTTADDAYLAPFKAAIAAHVPFVMMSTAIYSKIDPGVPAAFSHKIVTDILRTELGFRGVVITDDVGVAKQVAYVSTGDRAVKFIEAGGDMVLTVDATESSAMSAALIDRASSDPAFRKLVDAAALRVLQAKQARGLLG